MKPIERAIEILTRDGPATIPATVIGSWAYHESVSDDVGWVVTHVPSGRNVCQAHPERVLTHDQARAIAMRLAAELPEPRVTVSPCATLVGMSAFSKKVVCDVVEQVSLPTS